MLNQKNIKKSLIKQSVFNISLPLDIPPGIYRLIYSQSESNGYIDLIINGLEPFVVFSLDVNKNEKLMYIPFKEPSEYSQLPSIANSILLFLFYHAENYSQQLL